MKALPSAGIVTVMGILTFSSGLLALERPITPPARSYTTRDIPGSFDRPSGDFPMITAQPDSGVPSIIDSLVDYGGQSTAPTNYPNARHCEHDQVEGVPVAAYEYGPSRNQDVVCSRWSEFGYWEPPQTVSDQVIDAGRIAIAMDQNDGILHAAWHQTDDGTAYYIRYARLLQGAAEWTDHATVSRQATGSVFPSMAVSPEGEIWVSCVEEENHQVAVNHSTDGGETWEGAEVIPGGPWSYWSWNLPALFCSEDGKVHLVFENYSDVQDGMDIMYTSRNPDTGVWNPAEMAAAGETGHLFTASLVADSRGEVHIAGLQGYGAGSNYGNIGTIKHIHGFPGQWSVDTPFLFHQGTEDAWLDSFAAYPTIGIDSSDNLYMVYAQADTVIEQSAVSGLYLSCYRTDQLDWNPVTPMTEVDEEDVVYPTVVMHIDNSGVAGVSGAGVVYSGLVAAQQPASVYYMYLGNHCPSPGVTLSGFRAEAVAGAIRLTWNGNTPAVRYNVYRSANAMERGRKLNDIPLRTATFLDRAVTPGVRYFYRVTSLDARGRESAPDNVASVTVPGSPAMTTMHLKRNVPNPFNPHTRISFQLGRRLDVGLKVYDCTGKLIRVLMNDADCSIGTHVVVFDGRDDHGNEIPSGVYYVRLEAGSYCGVARMMCVR